MILTGRPGIPSGGLRPRGHDLWADNAIALVAAGSTLARRMLAHPFPIIVARPGQPSRRVRSSFCPLTIASGWMVLSTSQLEIEVEIGMTMHHVASNSPATGSAKSHLNRSVINAEMFDPQQAMAAGFPDAVVAPDELMPAARAVAEDMKRPNMSAHAKTKVKMRAGLLRILMTPSKRTRRLCWSRCPSGTLGVERRPRTTSHGRSGSRISGHNGHGRRPQPWLAGPAGGSANQKCPPRALSRGRCAGPNRRPGWWFRRVRWPPPRPCNRPGQRGGALVRLPARIIAEPSGSDHRLTVSTEPLTDAVTFNVKPSHRVNPPSAALSRSTNVTPVMTGACTMLGVAWGGAAAGARPSSSGSLSSWVWSSVCLCPSPEKPFGAADGFSEAVGASPPRGGRPGSLAAPYPVRLDLSGCRNARGAGRGRWGLAAAEPMIVPRVVRSSWRNGQPVTTIPTATSSRTAITAATGRSHAGERRASSGRGKPSASNGAAGARRAACPWSRLRWIRREKVGRWRDEYRCRHRGTEGCCEGGTPAPLAVGAFL